MTAERDPVEALEDILQNMALAKKFSEAVRTIDELEADPKTLYSVMRTAEPRIRALLDRLAEAGSEK